jgi:hypothetical protein
MYVDGSDDMYLWHNAGDSPTLPDGWVISPEMRTDEEMIMSWAEGTPEGGPPEHGWRLLPCTSTVLMSCELLTDPLQSSDMWPPEPPAPPQPHQPWGLPPLKLKGKGKKGTEKGDKGFKGTEKGDKGFKGTEKGGKGKYKGTEKGGKGKGTEKAGKHKGTDKADKIHRGGWFSKCQRLSACVLNQEWDEATSLSEEYYAGPEPL